MTKLQYSGTYFKKIILGRRGMPPTFLAFACSACQPLHAQYACSHTQTQKVHFSLPNNPNYWPVHVGLDKAMFNIYIYLY